MKRIEIIKKRMRTMKQGNCLKLDRLILIVTLLLFGGFYDWNIAFVGCCICLYAMMLFCKKQPIYRKEHKLPLWLPEIIILFQFLVLFWAVDRSANISGIMRGISILLWMYICLQMDDSNKERLLLMIPRMGECMVICGSAALLFQRIKPFFWRAERFGGFFQYANTCALFLLLGIVICYFEWDRKITLSIRTNGRICCRLVLLLLGVLLTGSRSILMFLVLWGSLHSVRNKKFRNIFIGVTIGGSIILGGYYLLTGSGTQNISRIFTEPASNSTFYGRLLYDIDGISILLKHPMGLGYLGYYYVQHMLQTGVYTVRFIHNDILQLGLDYGIIPMFLFICYMIWQLAQGKQTMYQKELLVIILIASLVDFHMQYLLIDFIIILCLDLGSQSIKQNKTERLENCFLFGVLTLGFIFCFIPYFAVYNGRPDIAIQFMPNNTEALRIAMIKTNDRDTACSYAEKVLQNNKYIADAYNVKAYAAAMENDIASVIKNQDEVLRLERYDVDRYCSYDLLLEQLALQYEKIGEYQTVEQIEEKRMDIRKQLASLREQTNPIAYKLRDIPKYTW